MPVHLLSDAEFAATFVDPMRPVGEEEDCVTLDLSTYVRECFETQKFSYSGDEVEIHAVNISGDAMFTHILLYYGQPNVYLVIVVDNTGQKIQGHHWLDLNAKYGITPKN